MVGGRVGRCRPRHAPPGISTPAPSSLARRVPTLEPAFNDTAQGDRGRLLRETPDAAWRRRGWRALTPTRQAATRRVRGTRDAAPVSRGEAGSRSPWGCRRDQAQNASDVAGEPKPAPESRYRCRGSHRVVCVAWSEATANSYWRISERHWALAEPTELPSLHRCPSCSHHFQRGTACWTSSTYPRATAAFRQSAP